LIVDMYQRDGTIINMPEELEVERGKVYYIFANAVGEKNPFVKDGYITLDRFWRLDNAKGERVLKECNPPPLATPEAN
jgi:hypothetical protein